MITRGKAREQILDSAEQLFAVHGVEGASLRSINAAAGVSPSVLHYHFGSVESLIEAVINRHMTRIIEERRGMLQELVHQTELSIQRLVEAVVFPFAKLAIEEGQAGLRYVRLIARLYADRNPILEAVSADHLKEIQVQIPSRLLHSLTRAPNEVLNARWRWMYPVIFHALAELGTSPRGCQAPVRSRDKITLWAEVNLLVEFLTSGLTAPHTRIHKS